MTTTVDDNEAAKAEPVVSPLALPGSRYPTGWFQIGWSDDVVAGQVRRVHYFGRDIVLWRGESGCLNAVDAYCLHLGGNLGVRGTVEGEEIVCPWHHWHWSGEGRNTLIPYSGQRCKPHLQLQVWPLQEWYGCILLWHDLAGRPPTWQPPALADFDDGTLFPIVPAMRRQQQVKAHPQMVIENGADAAHVAYIHGAGTVPVIQRVEIDGPHWRTWVSATYGAGKESTWLTPGGAVDVTLTFSLWGIGLGTAEWPADLLRAVMITNPTPVDEVHTEIFWCMSTAKGKGSGDQPDRFAVKLMEHQWETVTQDFFTWENMKVLHTPNFAPEEAKHYATIRRWAWQFYPDGDQS
jgi:phenylpropionate dioxygenase-like ring-hydroxylating dioxygenase large terminal subunit